MSCSPLKVTPADYQPPGFKEGECDSLWFEGMAVHFKLGEVQTAFHSLRFHVSAEQGRLEKLQEGNKLREIKQVTNRNPPEKVTVKVGPERRSSLAHIAVFLIRLLVINILVTAINRLLVRKYTTKRIYPLKTVGKCIGADTKL